LFVDSIVQFFKHFFLFFLYLNLKNYSAPVIIGKMRVATQLAEEESEEIANLFVDGTSDVNSYIDNFILKRKLFHVRAAKLESVELDPNFFVTKS